MATHPKFRYSKMNVRFDLSARGYESFPRWRGRGGRIVGESKDKTCWMVLIDGNKYPYALAKSFVKILTLTNGERQCP